jgi:hypothetical protein
MSDPAIKRLSHRSPGASGILLLSMALASMFAGVLACALAVFGSAATGLDISTSAQGELLAVGLGGLFVSAALFIVYVLALPRSGPHHFYLLSVEPARLRAWALSWSWSSGPQLSDRLFIWWHLKNRPADRERAHP